MSRGAFRYRPHYGDPNQPPHTDFRQYNPPGHEQARQGEYSDTLVRDGLNIYEIVDSWRSYRNDTANLQTSSNHRWMPPRVPSDYMQGSYSPNMSANSSANFPLRHSNTGTADPSAPLRSVHSYARYPTYRVDKSYRTRTSTQGGGIVQQRQDNVPLAASHRYTLRSTQPQQVAAYSTSSQDVPLPSIEIPDAPVPHGRFTDLPLRQVRSGRSRSTIPRGVEPVPVPKPTSDYKKTAALPPALRQNAQKLLVILDLNGTLLVRPNRRADPTKFKIRPGVTRLLDYLFANHVVMVYSSARPENTTAMVKNFMHPVQRQQMAAVWARDKLGLTEHQYYNKVQVYKKLDKIWSDSAIQSKAEKGCKWNQGNTVLVDDSHLKGLAQPNNLLQVPEFENNAPREGGAALRDWQLNEQAILESLELKLEELKYQVDVSRLIRQWQTGQRQAPGVVDETIDQKTQQRIEQPEATPAPPSVGGTSPAPSVGYGAGPGGSTPTPSSLSRTVTLASEDELADGGGAGGGVGLGENLLDVLEKEIDRQLESSPQTQTIPSIDNGASNAASNNVHNDAPLAEKRKKKKKMSPKFKGNRKEKNKNNVEQAPPTPESLPP
ncbi:hypothetical protein PV08_04509 [Exophiala spinifera]|uniref:FCP1 homology domain-containing protein n=1 Tax=Exophiala spinifera TaxID=91928 RepID=A0A0D1ZXA6_9EURO|nr:uncharacterized protein PV08_04509 [Exophiala spinifera]KIW17317.1 hypothetical protein PV08_04509 [Exophiala spinifera]